MPTVGWDWDSDGDGEVAKLDWLDVDFLHPGCFVLNY